MKIPIFIICRDRIECTKKAIASYEKLNHPIEIIIHDNNSTYPPMIEWLEELEKNGIKVYRTKEDHTPRTRTFAHLTAESIADWMNHNKASYYVVTDPDIELDSTPDGDNLEVYAELLDKNYRTGIKMVGPMLRIDDIPDTYAKKETATGRHNFFWWKEKKIAQIQGKEVTYNFSPIDTTFALQKANEPFNRHQKGIRVYAPYTAKHLDWYIDLASPTPDHKWYRDHCHKGVAHWG